MEHVIPEEPGMSFSHRGIFFSTSEIFSASRVALIRCTSASIQEAFCSWALGLPFFTYRVTSALSRWDEFYAVLTICFILWLYSHDLLGVKFLLPSIFHSLQVCFFHRTFSFPSYLRIFLLLHIFSTCCLWLNCITVPPTFPTNMQALWEQGTLTHILFLFSRV